MNHGGFTTKAVHASAVKANAQGALQFPLFTGAAYEFETAEAMRDSFAGKKAAHAYSRISNPTVEAFEIRMARLEDGRGAIAASSGMAAISTVLLNLLSAGDSLVVASSLFGGTFSLLRNVLAPLGIQSRFVPITDPAAVEEAIDGSTRALFVETIANPGMVVPDFAALSGIARRHGIVLVADGTVTTPYLFNARGHGVDIIIHSTTKYISGGWAGVGGIIVDLGTFDWGSIPSLKQYRRFNEMAFIARLRREVHRETGCCMSPLVAGFQSMGLETLSLRMDRICGNAARMADFLALRDDVRSVGYPGLAASPFHEVSRKQFNGMFGGILTFELNDAAACYRFLNGLSLIKKATNFGDNRSLAIHPASTIFAGMPPEERVSLGAPDAMIRLSAGIEDPDDIIDDIGRALGSAA